MAKKIMTIALVLAALTALVVVGCNPPEGPIEYTITIENGSGGTVTASVDSAEEGTTITVTVTPDTGYETAAGTLLVNDGAVTLTGTASPYTFVMPADDVVVKAEFDPMDVYHFNRGTTVPTGVTVGANPGNAIGALNASIADKHTEAQAGYVDLRISATTDTFTDNGWQADGQLPLGNGVLAFEYGTSVHNGLVTLSFKNLDLGSFVGKTGFEFDVSIPSIPGGGGIGINPHLRYNDGASENAVVFNHNWWAYRLADDVWYHVKIDFASMTKPVYSDANDYDTVAEAIDDEVAFNQLDMVFRIDTDSAFTGALNTKYTGYIDNVKLY